MEANEPAEKWMGLVEVEDGQLLLSPLSKAVKTKYTCMAASSSHVVLGANTGSLYCFTAKGFKYVRLLANMEGAVSIARFSPDEKTLAIVVGNHTVCFWETNLEEEKTDSKRFHVSTILNGGIVTDVLWDGNTRLFYGDNQGRVAIAFIPKMSRKFGSSSIFKRVDEIIHVEKCPIVQLDIHKELLLVSSYHRSCLLKLTNEMIVANITKVGTKSRDGPYGALFHPRVPGRPPVVYSARQGGRMWEADIAGTVVSTVKQRDLISATPSNILSPSLPFLPPSLPPKTVSTLSFSRLLLMFNKYLVAWQKDGLFIFHPSSYSLSCWTNVLQDITQVECVKEKLYVLHDNCQKITCVSFMDMFDTLIVLQDANNPPMCNEFLVMHSSLIQSQILSTEKGKEMIVLILQSIIDVGQEISSSIKEWLQLIPKEDDTTTMENSERERNGVVPSEWRNEGETIEEKVMDTAIVTIKQKVMDTAIVEESVNEEEGMFLMEDGYCKPDKDDTIESNQTSESFHGIKSFEEMIFSTSAPFEHSQSLTAPQLEHSQSLTTHPLISDKSSFNVTSLPNSFDQILTPSSSIGGISPSNTLPIEQAPLSVRMGNKLNVGEDEISVVGVAITKKKKKGLKKKKRTVSSKTKSQQDLEDIFESSVAIEISPSTSRLSSTNPSEENSRASSPFRTESKNTSTDIDIDRLSLDSELNPSDNNNFVPHRSMSLDPSPTAKEYPDTLQLRRQSLDLMDTDLSSRLGIQKPSVILSKVKSLASTQQEKTGRKVKELFSSLSPTPSSTGSVYPTIPVASVVSPPSSEVTIGVSSPSPEIGVVTTGYEECDGGSALTISPQLYQSSSPVPDIETERFVAFTTEAMTALDDPVTLYSPEQFQHTLQQWRKEFSTYCANCTIIVSEERESIFSVPPFIELSGSLRHSISELVTLLLQNSLKSDEIPEFIEAHKLLLNINRTKEFIGTLDYEKMRECWNRLICDEVSLQGLSVNDDDEIDKTKQFILNNPLTGPKILQRLFQSDSSKFLKLCSTFQHVNLWEVAMVTCDDALADSSIGLRVFGEYLNQSLTVNGLEYNQQISYLFGQQELFLLALRACLATHPENELFNTNQRPIVHSNRVIWNHETVLLYFSGMIPSMSSDVQQEAIGMIKEKGFWKGLCIILKLCQRTEELFSLIVDLRDIELLKDITKDSVFLVTSDEWKMFLQIAVLNNISMTSDQYLAIDSMVKEMVAIIGVDETCRVLVEMEGVDDCDLPSSVHQFLTDAAALHREKRTIAHLLLEKLDKHLWAARPAALGPQLLAMYKLKHSEQQQHTDVMETTPTLLPIPSALKVNIEDSISNWGARAESEKCGVCGFLISTKLSDRESGSFAFSCGHFYHKVCLPEQACVHCFVKTYSTFL